MSSIVPTTVKSVSTADFFQEINGNLTKITWAHAVNNRSLLAEVLSSKATD